MKNRAARVLIYSQDSLGLGHLRRNVNIAHELSRLAPDTAILFVTDSPLSPFFELPPNSGFIRLPTIIKVDAGVWKVHRRLLNTLDNISATRSLIVKVAALGFRPDVFLVDHMPHGARGELLESLQGLRRECPQTRIILGLRDILGAPDVIVRQWRSESAYRTIAEYYDLVLIYGCQDVYDLASEYEFPEDLQRKVRYCGYVCPSVMESPKAAAKLSSQFLMEKPFTVLVMGGGGSDAHFFMDAMLDAIRYLGSNVPFNTLMLTGPFMPDKDRKALLRKAERLPVTVKHKKKDIVKYLLRVDLVVSMAGYNTMCEILKFAKKAVVIPRAGPSAEQGMRSRIWHDRGLIFSIPPRDITPQMLAETVVGRLYEQNVVNTRQLPDLNGATCASRLVLDCATEIARAEFQPVVL